MSISLSLSLYIYIYTLTITIITMITTISASCGRGSIVFIVYYSIVQGGLARGYFCIIIIIIIIMNI